MAKFVLHSTRTRVDFRGPETVTALCGMRVKYSCALLFQNKPDAAVNCVGCRVLIAETLGLCSNGMEHQNCNDNRCQCDCHNGKPWKDRDGIWHNLKLEGTNG